MARASNAESGHADGVSGLDHAAVHAQLARLLESPHFRNSKRSQALLRFVVQAALAGDQNSLKERCIGAAVFGREPAYDTAQDPIVRNAAIEVRKRLAQYYLEPEHAAELRIELPSGSYMPVISGRIGRTGTSGATAEGPRLSAAVDRRRRARGDCGGSGISVGCAAHADVGSRGVLGAALPGRERDPGEYRPAHASVSLYRTADGGIEPAVRRWGTHELTYRPGTQWPTGGTIVLDGDDGVARKYELRLAGTPADVQAGGYYRGWRDGLGPGIYRGPEVQEIDDYDVTPGGWQTGPPHVPVRHRLGPTEFPMHMVGPDGTAGMAHFEHSIRGEYRPYGLG